MLKWLLLLGAAIPDPIQDAPVPLTDNRTSNLSSFQMRDILLICGAAVAMGLVLFLWAYLTRKNRQQEAAASRGARILSRPDRDHSEHHGRKGRVRMRKRRRDHPESWGRNPTLAEAGGLPPLRPEEPEPRPPSPANTPEVQQPTRIQ